MDPNKHPHEARHLGVLSGASKNDFCAYVTFGANATYLVLRLELSSNGPKRTSTWASSPRSTIWCLQKQFLSLWYVWRKWCTYLAPTLTLSLNGSKRDSTWPTSPRSSIGRIQNNFRASGMFCTYQIELPVVPRHQGVPSGASKMISEPMVRLAQTVHLSCTNTNTVSKWTEIRFHMTHVT
jgi:hypothetical protein